MVFSAATRVFGRRQDDALPQGVVLQPRIGLAGRGEQRLARDERHHELGRTLELPPVLLLGQLVHVGAQLPGVLLEERLALVLVVALDELQEGVERHLRVDDHLAAAGQVHDHVGTEQAVLGRGRPLLLEVAVLGHAGRLRPRCAASFRPSAPASAATAAR